MSYVAARNKKGEKMYYGEVTWFGIIVFFLILIIEHKKKKREETETYEMSKRHAAEEAEKFHKWWDENMAEKYGEYRDGKDDDRDES